MNVAAAAPATGSHSPCRMDGGSASSAVMLSPYTGHSGRNSMHRRTGWASPEVRWA